MWEFISYFEVKQLFETHPVEFSFGLLLFVGAFGTIVVMLAGEIASFRLFSISNVHHHHHYHPEADAPEPHQTFGRRTATSTSQASSKPKRAKMKGSKRMRILRRDGFRCQLCGRKANDAEELTLHVDHRMPVAKGGGDEDSNLWTLCHECNGAKSDTIMEELLEENTEAANTDNKAEQSREQ